MGCLPPGNEEKEDKSASPGQHRERFSVYDSGIDPGVKGFRKQVKDESAEDHQCDGGPVQHHGALDERDQKQGETDADPQEDRKGASAPYCEEDAAEGEQDSADNKDRDGEIDQ